MLRDDRLEQLSDDHSLVAELVRRGELSPKEAETHPQRSVITRALGTDPDVDVDTFAVEGRPGDVFLLCSDGLSSMVDDSTVERVLGRNRADLDAAARALVAEANRGGGEDNITAVLFELGDGDGGGDTRSMPAVTAVEPDAAVDPDEDTLEGLRIPQAVDTIVVPPEPAGELPPSEAETLPEPAARDPAPARVHARPRARAGAGGRAAPEPERRPSRSPRPRPTRDRAGARARGGAEYRPGPRYAPAAAYEPEPSPRPSRRPASRRSPAACSSCS